MSESASKTKVDPDSSLLRIEALIFDFDGLIVDTETPVYEGWRHVYAAHDHELPLEIYAGCVGSDFGGFDPVQHLEEKTGSEIDWDHWNTERRSVEKGHLADRDTLPGVRELLAAAENAAIPRAIASSSPRSWVEPWLEKLGIREHFTLTRCLDDVARPKPDPELFATAAHGLGVESRRALVLEDSLNGLHAATAAGSPCVIIPNAITAHLDFSSAAHHVPSMAELTLEDCLSIHKAE